MMADAMCAVATATSHVIALRLKVPTARLPALTSVTVATAKDTVSKNAPPPTQS